MIHPARKLSALFRSLMRSEGGAVAMMFGLVVIVVIAAVGVGIDLWRAYAVKARLQSSLDSAALAIGSSPSTYTDDQLKARLQAYVSANYPANVLGAVQGTPTYNITNNGGTITVSATASVPTTFMKIWDYNSLSVHVVSQAMRTTSLLDVALVLDNTGSMSDSLNSTTSKIDALKTATHNLLTQLQNAAAQDGDVNVSIVPFAKDVNIGTTYVNSSWIDWSTWSSPPANSTPSSSVGPGSNCPYSSYTNGFGCQQTPANGSTTTSRIPSSGTYTGYICPTVDNGNVNPGLYGSYYNGCYQSVATWTPGSCNGFFCSCPSGSQNCSCTRVNYYSNSCTYQQFSGYSHPWVANDHSTWNGCVMDRVQNYDADNTRPTTTATDFPAENSQFCPPATLKTLGYDWSALSTEVDSMQPNGNTNQTVGLDWGWFTMTPTDPLNPPAPEPNRQLIVILVTDGKNTQDRWYQCPQNGPCPTIDARVSAACTNMKAAGVIIYTLQLGDGNTTLLTNCATDSSKHFYLTSADQVVTAFNQIGTELTKLRLTK